jgi:hypothetical protein
VGLTQTDVDARAVDIDGLLNLRAIGKPGHSAGAGHDVLERPSLRHIAVFSERLWCAQQGSDW